MADSILNSTKKALGIAVDYTEFDIDLVMFINSALSTLNQLGIGPIEGFSIEDSEATWDDFLLGDERMNSVQTYVTFKVRLMFDPPPTSFGIAALEKMLTEWEWRLNVVREGTYHGIFGSGTGSTGVIDGGSP